MTRKEISYFVFFALLVAVFEFFRGGVFVYRHYGNDGILVCRAIASDTLFKCEKVKYEQDH